MPSGDSAGFPKLLSPTVPFIMAGDDNRDWLRRLTAFYHNWRLVQISVQPFEALVEYVHLLTDFFNLVVRDDLVVTDHRTW